MQTYRPDTLEPWYRNPWVWLLIAIPSLTVAGCLLTVYLALANPDYLVDEYVLGTAPPAEGSTDAEP